MRRGFLEDDVAKRLLPEAAQAQIVGALRSCANEIPHCGETGEELVGLADRYVTPSREPTELSLQSALSGMTDQIACQLQCGLVPGRVPRNGEIAAAQIAEAKGKKPVKKPAAAPTAAPAAASPAVAPVVPVTRTN